MQIPDICEVMDADLSGSRPRLEFLARAESPIRGRGGSRPRKRLAGLYEDVSLRRSGDHGEEDRNSRGSVRRPHQRTPRCASNQLCRTLSGHLPTSAVYSALAGWAWDGNRHTRAHIVTMRIFGVKLLKHRAPESVTVRRIMDRDVGSERRQDPSPPSSGARTCDHLGYTVDDATPLRRPAAILHSLPSTPAEVHLIMSGRQVSHPKMRLPRLRKRPSFHPQNRSVGWPTTSS